jgi:hypothetical protein
MSVVSKKSRKATSEEEEEVPTPKPSKVKSVKAPAPAQEEEEEEDSENDEEDHSDVFSKIGKKTKKQQIIAIEEDGDADLEKDEVLDQLEESMGRTKALRVLLRHIEKEEKMANDGGKIQALKDEKEAISEQIKETRALLKAVTSALTKINSEKLKMDKEIAGFVKEDAVKNARHISKAKKRIEALAVTATEKLEEKEEFVGIIADFEEQHASKVRELKSAQSASNKRKK